MAAAPRGLVFAERDFAAPQLDEYGEIDLPVVAAIADRRQAFVPGVVVGARLQRIARR